MDATPEGIRGKQKTIGGRLWTVAYFPPSRAWVLQAKVVELVGPVILAAFQERNAESLVAALRNARLSEQLPLVRELLSSTYAHQPDGKMLQLTGDLLDHPELFWGPEGMETLHLLLAFVVEANFRGPLLSSRLGAIFKRAEPAALDPGAPRPSL